MSNTLNDNQLEAIRRLIAVADLIPARGGSKINLSWEDYSAVAVVRGRLVASQSSKTFETLDQLKQDLGVLINLADQARKAGLLTWDEGALVLPAIQVFIPPKPAQPAAPAPPARNAPPSSKEEGLASVTPDSNEGVYRVTPDDEDVVEVEEELSI